MRVIERFEEKVHKTEGCWLWQAALMHKGYGHMGVGKDVFRTNRLAWILYRGPIPKGLQVLHTCDNRACVNPAHLFLGTDQDNMDDKVKKGRYGPRLKITPEMWAELEPRLSGNETAKAIAKDFGLSTYYVQKVRQRFNKGQINATCI